MDAALVLLPGDGIGPEVVAEAAGCWTTVAARWGHRFDFAGTAIGGNAIDDHGDPLPEATLEACRGADAVLLGAVGGPKLGRPEGRDPAGGRVAGVAQPSSGCTPTCAR